MAGLTTDRDLNDLIEESQKEGFVIEKCGSGHLKWTPPKYPEAAFTTAATPTSPRVVEHAKLQKRRALAGYSDRLPLEMRHAAMNRLDVQNQARKEAKRELTAKAFKGLLDNVKTKPPEFPTPKLAPVPKGPIAREQISMFTAAKKAKELQQDTNLTIEECAQSMVEAFDVMTPARTKTTAQSILNIINRKRKVVIEVPQVIVPDPNEDLLGHIRSTLKLPLDKKVRMEIVAGLLEQHLT